MPTSSPRRAPVPKAKRTLANMPGSYQGSFNKKLTKKKVSPYVKKGHTSIRQLHGTQSQSDCAWLGVRSVVQKQIGFDAGIALIRHVMFQEDGTTYNYIEQQLTQPTHGFYGVRFFAERQRDSNPPTGVVRTFNFGTDGVTLKEFADWFETNVFSSEDFNYSPAQPGQSNQYLKAYAIIRQAGNGALEQGPLHDIEHMYVKAYSNVNVVIQNITEADGAATGNPLDKHRVDSNPIRGSMYKFSTPTPIIRADSNSYVAGNEHILAQDPNGDGIIFPQSDLEAGYRAPVPASHFFKCSGSSRVSLAPGAMKKCVLNFRFDGTLNNLMHGLFVRPEASTPDPRDRSMMGTCIMFAFQKRMRTGANTITMNWQADYKTGVCVKKVVRPVMSQRFNASTITRVLWIFPPIGLL